MNYSPFIDYYVKQEKKEKLIGLEIELLGYTKNYQRIPYRIISEVLQCFIKEYNWKSCYEDESIIGVESFLGHISLEPGCQFEWSSFPYDTITELKEKFEIFKKQLLTISKKRDLIWLNIGYDPFAKPEEIEFIPIKKRYKIFRDYFTSSEEIEMMLCSCGSHLSFDYSSEEDMRKKLYIGNALSFLVGALSSNAGIIGRKIAPSPHYRGWIWEKFDKTRTGWVQNVDKENFGYKDYIDYVLSIPTIFSLEKDNIAPSYGKSISEIYGNDLTLKQYLLHAGTVFPNTRLKNIIEIRTSDASEFSFLLAEAAFWKGIFYDNQSLDKTLDFIQKISLHELRNLFLNYTTKLDLWKKIMEYLTALVSISKVGLQKIAEREIEFLLPLEERLQKNIIISEKIRQEFQPPHDILEILQKYHLILE